MDIRELIKLKVHGRALGTRDIARWIDALVKGQVLDCQTVSLLMAIVLNGLSFEETLALTSQMAKYGNRLPRSKGIKRVGKHSTGGVGDKTTFLLGPLLASYGVQVSMMAGRGLGHTGGTIDKLSGIPGLSSRLSPARIVRILKKNRFCIFEQTPSLAPADRILYALRDASGTVESIPLIVASILSKKLIEGLDALVLDVKFGSGALMADLREAKKLATTLRCVGSSLGLPATVVLSNMDQPLGHAIGNNLEIIECMETFLGRGPKDLIELTVTLGLEMLRMVLPKKKLPTRALLQQRLVGGELYGDFLAYLKSSGAKISSKGLDLPIGEKKVVYAKRSGCLASLDARALGEITMYLGGGRMNPDDGIDPRVGIVVKKKVGDFVEKGEAIFEIYFKDVRKLHSVRKNLEQSFLITHKKVAKSPVVAEILSCDFPL